jgi:uncharacterized protein YbjT (DUF2867 family)
MRIVIAGGHGQIALLLERLLSESGQSVLGLVRNPDHVVDLEAVGASAAVVDLEHASYDDLVPHLVGADAVVFAAGAGPGSGAERKQTVDRDAAILLADAAEAAEVERYVMVSAMGAAERADDASLDPVFRAYLRAKAEADAELRRRTALETTIVCPGRLIDEPGTGRVELGPRVQYGVIPRADVAAVLAGVLDRTDLGGRALDVVSGDVPVRDALATFAGH